MIYELTPLPGLTPPTMTRFLMTLGMTQTTSCSRLARLIQPRVIPNNALITLLPFSFYFPSPNAVMTLLPFDLLLSPHY